MPEALPNQDDIEALLRYDTPTICNALEVVMPERRATGFTTRHMVPANTALKSMVGFARTATFRSVEPPPLGPAEMRARRAQYYEYISGGPVPAILVIQDLDPEPGFGAFWGEVNSAIHKGLGCVGAVTNGSMRDIAELAPGFQILAGSIGPSHAHGHVVDWGGQVNVFGMSVKDGDLVHADRHGAVVVPAAAVGELPAAVDLIVRREKVILDVARAEGFDIGKLKKAMADSADIH